ncbi:hypothetical protein [Streptomyces sp. NBC_01176]|uniref:hypothetical protein n=1 Tax=Streptomyces sp. NBC_01176 TaxID=2903760 RepID=UPI002F914B2B|nr:hypothetical protein OG199_43770 [Streptomyces sp. NBC_01176]
MTAVADNGVGMRADEADEVLLVRARRRLRELVALLEIAPFAAATTDAMRAYLDEDADDAGEAFARFCGLSPTVRAQRAASASEALS